MAVTDWDGHMPDENYCSNSRTLSAQGGDEHEYVMGEHTCQTPCRELLIPLRGQVRGTRVAWTLLSITKTSADEDTNQLVLIVVHLQRTRMKTQRRMLC